MGKKSKRVRIPTIGRSQKDQMTTLERRREVVPQLTLEGHREASPQRSTEGKLWRAEYVFQQYYEVTIDEQLIEKEWLSSFEVESQGLLQEEVERFRRMLRGIIADRKALQAICDHLVLAEQDSELGSSIYVTEYYDEAKEFIDMLVEQSHCFTAEDREWLLSLIGKCGKEVFDSGLQVEGLRVAFHLKPSGFCVGQHACRLEES